MTASLTLGLILLGGLGLFIGFAALAGTRRNRDNGSPADSGAYAWPGLIGSGDGGCDGGSSGGDGG